MDLQSLGWNDFFAAQLLAQELTVCTVGRVAAEYKHMYRVYAESGEYLASVTGKLRYLADSREDFPAVGDWVLFSAAGNGQAVIQGILPRQSKFSRKVAGKVNEEQIVAANIDTIFLVNALNQDFNLRRMERYLTLAWDSGASPVIVLNKTDLCPDVVGKVREVETIAFGVPVHPVSCVSGYGLADLSQYMSRGKTIALLGSSGAGKSTLVNRCLGTDSQKTGAIRQDDGEGRHTTTHRELILLPAGGILLDTPGMRELQLWGSEDGLTDTFDDIYALAAQCRFSDCRHTNEPGCAVIAALAGGALSQARYDSFHKLQRELAYLSRKENKQEYLAEKNRWKKIHKGIRQLSKN
ncbi:ribosome small subunit-dependent GTPase A [Sporomusa acidovorans]|uniref:Small ribosomal subunit biogenesis GTPase RsgA n=1 Tax=Sporomusa acidovorans (strain ATCC 49682 / DSM 3132 / Mol) TaxID=1123286 RepID=A0ABZ3IZL7_SPOA4|nr:ribosome small subunit-dependent GTPase A [Sporomusa acidovorans]OZC24240.1 putative ribosome biogenesis GTPase RsgA [Sporomusa acidovorans DSM 3132]SDF56589.1 ribosome biogenesis GTPase [Sporomusa acidovorans]